MSMATLVELLEGQQNPRLDQSAKLLDRLSQGVCAVEEHERLLSEAYDFLGKVGIPMPMPNLAGKLWTRVGAFPAAGLTLESDWLPEPERFAFSNACYDLLWKKDVFDCSGMFSESNENDPGGVVAAMNKGKQGAVKDHRCFNDIFLSEVRGCLDTLRKPLLDLCNAAFAERYGRQPTADELDDAARLPDMTDAIYAGFVQQPDRMRLPILEANALIHAAQRLNSRQTYKPNDLWDYRHAATALSSCDIFLTERSLSHMLNQPLLQVEERFGCIVVHKVDDAMRAVSQLTSRNVRRTHC